MQYSLKCFSTFIITLRSTFYCTIVIYFCHNFFKLNQTFILKGCQEDLWVSACLWFMIIVFFCQIKSWNDAKMTQSSSGDERCSLQWPLPWPLWLTSLAAMTLLMTVWRKSFSPATLGEKREMFSCLWRMASSNASLEFTYDRQHANGEEREREREKEEKERRRVVATESQIRVDMSRREKKKMDEESEREREGRHQTVIQIPWQGQKPFC